MAGGMTETKERIDRGSGTGLGKPWHVIVLNDNHNTFDGVAAALAGVVGMSFPEGMAYANRIHERGQAVVWSGHREVAEHYWNGLKQRGLTMAPLET
jgi:ATP-dependent Clp protease adaptor protein ClpS